jgi:hypothetical protein
MNPAFKLALASAVLVSTLSFHALGQKSGQSLQKQLVGQWSLVTFELIDAKGNKAPGVEGADPKGLLIFADNGRVSFQIISAIPKLAKDRLVTTPEENKAVAHGALSYYGTYTVNEADKTFTLKVERSSYPNQNGMELKRVIQSLTADELRYNNPARIGSAGGQNNLVWRRIK